MNETIIDMIDLSKLETKEPVFEKVNLSELLFDLCLSFDAVAFENEIIYEYDIEEKLVLERADKKNLTRMFNLLIDNAMKYVDGKEKRINISLKKEGRKYHFRIKNSGCEVQDEDREKVFDRFDFAARRRKFCTGVFNEAKDNSRSIYWYAEQFGEQVDDESVCTFVYELLWDVACADGWLHPTEKEILRIICSKLRIPEAYYHINYRRRFGTFREGEKNADGKQEGGQTGAKSRREWRRPYVSGRSTILEAYEILECDSSATNDELKASFHKVAKRYHPDLLRSNGVPEEMIKAATEKMAQINAAWEDIRRARGI